MDNLGEQTYEKYQRKYNQYKDCYKKRVQLEQESLLLELVLNNRNEKFKNAHSLQVNDDLILTNKLSTPL